ncbi:methyltransferase [Chryseobacterium sp. POL2]|uniref:tRNA1(Val) (adenine(37)-N6)-methyltransferase n=1 Tax=Chryseobacterium sp. POL2 TaxID=2713414 RepID=UPI0013E15842|nr:methyltransferase [Chryseobacterium sp. POL2]QIG90516.1 methyltransferase [Chryseobacterium sp. POL2]
MNVFRFQQFDIKQDSEVFRVGTDAVLLGVLADLEHAKNVLEIGTGTGVIAMMLAQRFPQTNILGVDVNRIAVGLASSNFKASPFANRLTAELKDIKTFDSEMKFDAIFSNPPYFQVNSSSKDVVARQKIELDFKTLIQSSSKLLNDSGKLIVIIPRQDEEVFISLCEKENLFLQRNVSIRGIVGGEVRRSVLEFSKLKADRIIKEEFVIEKSPRQYSDQYLELTKDFHLFKS